MSGIDASLDGGLHPCALDGDFWLAPQQAFHLIGDFLRALVGDLEDEICPNFLALDNRAADRSDTTT